MSSIFLVCSSGSLLESRLHCGQCRKVRQTAFSLHCTNRTILFSPIPSVLFSLGSIIQARNAFNNKNAELVRYRYHHCIYWIRIQHFWLSEFIHFFMDPDPYSFSANQSTVISKITKFAYTVSKELKIYAKPFKSTFFVKMLSTCFHKYA
jgi:hypothetical protein